MFGYEFFVDPSRCIGCESCVNACAECETHRGQSMIHLDFIDRRQTTATVPFVCMHCDDPTCAQVCPALAILITPAGVVQQADPSRCIGCGNCVYACPFGVPKMDVEARLMKKCNLCYDRTAQGRKPWCAQACPTQALWYGEYEEFSTLRRGVAINHTACGGQDIRTRVYHVVAEPAAKLDILTLLEEARADVQPAGGNREEAWVL